MSNFVFVLDINRKPLTPCKPGVARSLLNAGKASVFRQFPFTLILKKAVAATPEPLTVNVRTAIAMASERTRRLKPHESLFLPGLKTLGFQAPGGS